MPTPPNSQGGVATGTEAFASTKTQDALAFVSQLKDYAGGLDRELRAYGDVNTVGRDTQALREIFSNIHRCELQIAQAMGIDWNPSNST